jgi:hypothetical protein
MSLAKLYAAGMQELSLAFAKNGVALIGFDSNRQDAITEIDAFARISGLRFPIPKDIRNKVADQHGATRMPLAFLSMRGEPSAIRGGSTINSRLAPASPSNRSATKIRPANPRRRNGVTQWSA